MMHRTIAFAGAAILAASILVSPDVQAVESAADQHPATQRSRGPRTNPAESSQALALQVALDRAGFSPGEIDGVSGDNTTRALDAFAKAKGIDGKTARQQLVAEDNGEPAAAVVTYTITEADVAGPFTPDIPEEIAAQASLQALGFRDAVEALGERFHSSPLLLKKLNPGSTFAAGTQIRVPNAGDRSAIAANGPVRIDVSKRGMTLFLYSGDTLIFSAPVTSGSAHDPLPIGDWKVTGVAHDPPFHYNPALFWDASPADAKTRIAPGPNNPVGVVWIDLNKPHYGLHGTPSPDQVGHTASHGCVRLTNWDVLTVAGLVRPGTPVTFTE